MTDLIKRPPGDYPFDDDYALEDNYDDYLRGELAYANIDWDDVDPDLVSEHDALLEATPEELAAQDADALGDLARWAMVRAWRRHGNLRNALRLCEQILATPLDDRSEHLSYPDLRLETARLLAEEGRFDDAHSALEAYRDDEGSQSVEYARARGVTLILQGRDSDGLDVLMEATDTFAESDPELSLHFADDLQQAGLTEALTAFLDRAIARLAEGDADPSLLTELRLLRAGQPG